MSSPALKRNQFVMTSRQIIILTPAIYRNFFNSVTLGMTTN